ncbi:MAG: hypothetical protein HY665_07905 [Chloroflexi bacterium]|nr:hypothetical protein [Chloroflexota bacterium]
MKKRLLLRFGLALTVLALALTLVGPAIAWAGVSTRATISAAPTQVTTGGSVTLTITETNDSEVWTEVDLTPAWVELAPLGLILNNTSLGFSSSLNTDAILDLGETWTWTVVVTVNQDTTFVATGHGFTPSSPEEASIDVTYPVDLDERAEVTVTVTPPPPPPPGEGFTPGYWKNHLSDWPATGYATTNNFNAIFGVTNSVSSSLTLLQAINLGGGGERALIRHATAALLNAAHPSVDYPLTVAQLIALVQNAYATGDFNGAANQLDSYNNLGGSI